MRHDTAEAPSRPQAWPVWPVTALFAFLDVLPTHAWPSQVALAGFMPLAVFLLAAAFTAVSTGMSLTRVQSLSGAARGAADEKFGTWQMWQLGSGLVGIAVVPQVRWCGWRAVLRAAVRLRGPGRTTAWVP
jgi:hypothetical protein